MKSIAVVALDIHKKFSRAVALDAEGNAVESQDVAHGDKRWMREYLGKFSRGTPVVMEASFGWPWVSEVAEEMGQEPHLAQAYRARQLAKGMSKTDQRDAVWLGRLYLTGGKIFPEAYRAPAPVRGLRALFRTRVLFVSMQTQIKNSIHGTLFREGQVVEEATDLFSSKGMDLLASLDLSPTGREECQDKLSVLEDLRRHILKLEVRIKTKVKESPEARLLMTIPGVAHLTAFGLMAELGDFRRFPNGRALAAYAGVLPLNRESAGHDYGKKTGVQCNHYLKSMLIESVTGAIRGSARLKSLHSRVKARNLKKVGKARVAVARELAEIIHLVLTRQVPFLENPPCRPGNGAKIHPNRASQKHVDAVPAGEEKATRKVQAE